MPHNIALFAGTFDPYTNGHHDIVRKATALFDEVVVLIGVNVHKARAFDAGAMRDAIQAAIDADGLNARAVIHTGLVTDYCTQNGIRWYIRGLRNAADYAYEEYIARVNHMICPGVETLYLRSDEDVISSSMLRELMVFGKSVDEFVPPAVRPLLHQ